MMAEKITDENLRKELIAFGEKNIGAITSSTRPIYLKKLNHLRARQKQNAKNRTLPSTSKKLLGFSSDESADEDAQPAKSSQRRSVPTTRRGRSAPQPKESNKDDTDGAASTSSRKSSRTLASNLSRPALRSRQVNSNVPSSSSTPVTNNRRSSTRINSVFNESNNASVRSSYQETDSIGLQTSIADNSQQSETDYGIQIPESFDSSDSDLDVEKVPEFGESHMSSPEYTNKSMNTSFPMDSTFGSPSGYANSGARSMSMSAGSFYGGTPTSRTKSPEAVSRRSVFRSTTVDQDRNHVVSRVTKKTSRNSTTGYPFKVVEEKPSWKSSLAHHVSMFLVILFILFFISIGIMYWNMRSRTLQETESSSGNLMECGPDNDPEKKRCFEKENIAAAIAVVGRLDEILSKLAGDVECGYVEGSRNISKDTLIRKLDGVKKEVLDTAMTLIRENPNWEIKMWTEKGEESTVPGTEAFLESNNPTRSLWCRLSRALTKVLNILLFLVCVALVMSLGLALLRWKWRQQEEETCQVYDLVEQIIDILKNHSDACQDNPDIQPYMAIPHVRDMLIPLKDRKKKQNLWNKAVKFLSANESRVRVEMRAIQGEEFAVWVWLQACPNGSKVWQGQAFGEKSEGTSLNIPRYSPSPCLKIRNMFDLDVEYGDDWHVYIQDAILEKCGPDHRIHHIAVDKTSREGCVYVKCADEKAAGEAFTALHGWWFDGNLVTVKYLRLERYHERFPDSIKCRTYMGPSNTKKMSLSHPFHHSVMEQS